jgi:hypothetical protein
MHVHALMWVRSIHVHTLVYTFMYTCSNAYIRALWLHELAPRFSFQQVPWLFGGGVYANVYLCGGLVAPRDCAP